MIPEIHKAHLALKRKWPLSVKLRDWLRKWRPFGLTIIVTRPKVDHYCLIHGHEHIAHLYRGKGCRRCLKTRTQ